MRGNEGRSGIPPEILHLDPEMESEAHHVTQFEEFSHPEHNDHETARIITKGRVAVALAGFAVVSAGVIAARHYSRKQED